MPPSFRQEDERFISAYQQAALLLSRLLQNPSPNRRATILRSIDQVIRELDELTATYITEQLPEHFRRGSTEAVKALKAARFGSIDSSYSNIHTQALQSLLSDASLKFSNTLEAVRREARSALTRLEKERVITELVQSEITGTRPNVRQRLQDSGITAFRSGTRRWTLEDYSSMLTDTVLSEAHNTGAMTRYVSNGVQFAKVIERGDAKDVTCKFMREKIVWLGDRRLLPPYHPNCRGGIEPFIGTPKNPIMNIEDPRIPQKAKEMMSRSG